MTKLLKIYRRLNEVFCCIVYLFNNTNDPSDSYMRLSDNDQRSPFLHGSAFPVIHLTFRCCFLIFFHKKYKKNPENVLECHEHRTASYGLSVMVH